MVEVLLASAWREERWGAGGALHLPWSAVHLVRVEEQLQPLLLLACSWGAGSGSVKCGSQGLKGIIVTS